MPYNYELDESIFKELIQRNIFPTDPNKKVKLIYYKHFKTSKLVINNNSYLLIGVLQKTNVKYQCKCSLGDGTPESNNIYVTLTPITLLKSLTLHLSDTSFIVQHLKKTFMPDNWISENSYRKHNNIRTTK